MHEGDHEAALSRRDFGARLLEAFAAGSTAVSLLVTAGCARRADGSRCAALVDGEGATRRLTAGARATLEAAQARLLPSGPGSPGAREVGATAYLERALRDPEVDEDSCAVIGRGVARLDELASSAHGLEFAGLEAEAQDKLLETWQGERGAGAWFGVMLAFTFEAFLGDPVHGGNPDGVAWSYLEHRPGYPRPVPGAEAGR